MLKILTKENSPEFSQRALDWWNNPYIEKDNNSLADKIRVIIEPSRVDTGNITSSLIKPKKFEFKPQTWEQFIGQEIGKNRAKTIVKQFKRGMRSHVILSAIRGHGKTSYIELLAHTLGAKLIQKIGKQIDEVNIVDVINEINASTNPNVVLFVDEIDSTDKKVIKIFNSIIESFQIEGKQIRPFLFASATINKGILLKNNPDFLDRIQHHISFSRYTNLNLETIINQYHQHLYSEEKINPEDVKKIALNCKYNPRTAINLLENLIVNEDLNKVFTDCDIIKNGLTSVDIKILQVLNDHKKPMGSNAIATRCGLPEPEYLRDYEPFLYEFAYINRTPSRIITEKGIQLLKELK